MFKKILSLFLSCTLLSSGSSGAFGAMISADGKTNTTVVTSGNVTDVRTSTVSGNTGFNSFTNFDVYTGNTANLYLPDGTKNLINLVHDKASNIDGVLNAYKDGRIGGNIFFLNPNGIAIGAGGVVNVGALTLATPTKEFMNRVISSDRSISTQLTKSILAGDMPINALGLISVKGKINAVHGVGLMGGDITNSGEIKTNFNIADIVNTQGTNTDTELQIKDGRVFISAKNNFINEGKIIADADGDNGNGAQIIINAGPKVDIKSGTISALAKGDGYVGGNITLTAKDMSDGYMSKTNTAEVNIGDNVTIQGNDIKLEAIADNKQLFDEEDDVAATIGNYTIGELADTSLFGGGIVSTVKAAVTIGKNATIDASGKVDINSKATSAADMRVIATGAAVAYGENDVTSSIDLKENASIKAKGNVSLNSTIDTSTKIASYALTNANSFSSVDAAVSIALSDSSNKINLASGSTISGKDVSVKAYTDKSMDVSAFSAAFDDGIAAATFVYSRSNVDSSVSADGSITSLGKTAISSEINSKKNDSSASTSVGTSTVAGVFLKGLHWGHDKFLSWFNNEEIKTNEQTQTKVGISAAFSYNKHTNSSSASIGGTVKSDGDISLGSKVTDAVIRTAVSASVDSKAGEHEKENAVAGAVGIASFTNKSQAFIGENAVVDTKGKLDITSKSLVPYEITWARWEGVSTILDKLNSNAGLQSGFITTWSKSDAASNEGQEMGKVSIAGNVNIADFNTDSKAYIGKGAKVNQDVNYRTLAQAIAVDSEAAASSVNIAGNWSIGLPPVGTKGKVALGGSYQQIGYNSKSYAGIEDDAVVTGSDLTVKSTITQRNISIAEAGGKSETFGFEGAFNWLKSDTTSNAYVSKDAKVSILGSGVNKVSISATDDIDMFNIAGGVVQGKNVGIGVSVALSDINRNTNAYIGDFRNSASTARGKGYFNSDKAITLFAQNDGDIYSYSLAGAIINDSKPSDAAPDPQGSDAPAGGGKFGVGLSGDVSYNNIEGSASSYIKNANLTTADSLSLSATDAGSIQAIAGAVSINTTDKKSVGFAGSASINNVKNRADSFVDNSAIELTDKTIVEVPSSTETTLGVSIPTLGGKLDLYAKSLTSIIAVAASGALSNPKAKGGNLAGSVTVNNIANNTLASIKDSTVNISNKSEADSISLSAIDNSSMAAIAGAISVAGTVGIGSSTGVNEISNKARVFIENSSLVANNNIKLNAENKSSITNVEGTVGASKDGLAAAASVAVNEIDNSTQVYIDGGTTSSKLGSVSMKAADTSNMTAVAGEVTGAGKVAVGISTAVNTIKNKTSAYITNAAEVSAAGNVAVDAVSNYKLKTAAVGGAASELVSATGSVAVNNIKTDTQAYVKGSTVTAQGSAGFNALSGNEINFYGGTINGSKGAGIGGTVVVNNVSDTAYAGVKEGSSVNAYGKTALYDNGPTGLLVSANVNDDINNWIFNLAGGDVGIAATVGVTNVDNKATAEISGSNINQTAPTEGEPAAAQNVKVSADNTADIETYGGSVAAGGTAGIGAVADTVLVDNITKAGISGSTVSAVGNIDVTTNSLERYNTILISGGGSATAGIAGNAATVLFNNKNEAYIIDSTVNNSGNTLVEAKDTAELGRKDGKDFAVAVGAAAGGATAGIGGAVLVSNIKNNTKAAITDSKINTGKSLKVRAEGKQDIVSYLPTAGLGGSIGVSASVGVNTIDSKTEAYIDQTKAGGTIINGEASKADDNQDVEVSANSSSRIKNTIATAGVGLKGVGIGAGIGVSTINGKVASGIGAGTEVNAKRNIKVESTNTRAVDDTAVALAGGLYGAVNGSILVTNIGSNLDGDSKTATEGIQNTLNDHLNTNANINKDTFGRGGLLDPVADSMQEFISDVNNVFNDKVLADNGTNAYIGANAKVHAGNKLGVLANDIIKTNLIAGGAGIGGYSSFGSSVAIVNNTTSTKAFIGDNAEVSSAGELTLKASSDVQESDVLAFVGQGSAIAALGAAVSKVNSNNNTLAYLSDYVRLNNSGNVNINAVGKSNIHVQTVGVAAGGGIAVGASIANVNKEGSTSAFTGEEVTVDNTNSLNIKASTDSNISAEAQAGSGGILAGVGTDAGAKVKDKVSALIGKQAIINTKGGTSVITEGRADASAKTYGVDIGGLAVGVSLADAVITLDNKAAIERGSTINADFVKVVADQKKAKTAANAFAASGALIGGAGAVASSKVSGSVLSNIHSKNTITAVDGITFTAKSNTDQSAESSFYGGAVISAGVNESYVVSDVDVKTLLNDGLTIKGKSIEISSEGFDKLYAKAASGSGGVLSAAAAIADTKNTSDSKVEIGERESEDGSSVLNNNITAQKVYLKSVNTTTQDSEVDSRNGGLIHAGGAIVSNTSDMNVAINLKDRVNGATAINANHFKAEALNNYNKNIVKGANVYSGSGGAIDVPITESKTKVNAYTDVLFGNNNKVRTDVDANNSSSFLVNVLNNIKGDDKVLLKSGGLVVVPIVTSEINNTNRAAITVNKANLHAWDDLVFNTKSDVDIAAGADLNVYGGIVVAAGKSLARTVVNNSINLNSGADIYSGGDSYFTFSQPKTETNSVFDNTGRAYIRASGITNIWNATPLSSNVDSQAKGDIFVNNNMNINKGAAVKSGKDININGVKALMSAIGLLDMTTPLGQLAASEKATSVITDELTNVKVDGALLAGVNNIVDFTIDSNRNIIVNGGSLPEYAIKEELLSNNIMAEIDRLKVLKAQYSVSEVSAAAYQAEINRLQAELSALGQIDSNGLMLEVPVDFITFKNISANMGDIRINADNINGSGKISAPGDAKIKIHNASNLFVRFGDISVDPTSTGSIFYNGALVKTAQEIASANKSDKTVSLGEVSSSGGLTGDKPSVEIISDYSYNNRAPNIEFTGDILNDNGNIKVSSSGSIQVKGNMRGQTIDISAEDKIVQSYAAGSFLHVGGNPYEYWKDIANESESDHNNRVVSGEGRGGNSSIVGNNVFLSASYLDLNGLIQSGTKDLKLDIAENFTLSANGLTFNSIDAALADYWARKNNHESNVNELYAVNNSGNIQAFFNVLENRIELKDTKVSGGRLELFGHILNTGGNTGELKVLDGYGRINVVNNSSYDLFVNSLDASTKIDGVIKITDTARKDATGGFYETIYKRIGNDLLTINSNTRDENGLANNIISSIAGGKETSYNPVTGQRYYWNTGKEKITETTYKKEQNTFWGMDFLVPDDSYELTNVRNLQDHALYEGEFVKTGQDTSNTYDYTFENKNVILYDEKGNPVVDEHGKPVPFKSYDKRWSTSKGWWIFAVDTMHHEVKYESGSKEINTHSIKADYPVKITFDGYDKGALDINASKSNIILNGLISNTSGDVNITASNGAIKANNADAYIKGHNINLNAKNGIGGDNAININLSGGAVTAQAVNGNINLAAIMSSDLVFNNIASTNGNVKLNSERNIYGLNANSKVKGKTVNFNSTLGSVGAINTPVNIEADNLSASAQGYININNDSTADLGVVSIESKNGDVNLKTKGSIYDANKNEVVDQRTKEELLNDWNALDLMDQDGAGWTEDQLSYKIDAASLDNKVNTQYMVEDPNIKGKNVTVKAGGAIGQDSGSESFNIADFKSLSDEQKLLIASAERDNIFFSEDGQTMTVLKREDFDIHADKVNLNANGFIYLGAEQDINVGNINAGAGHNITIMGAGNIYNVTEQDIVNINGKNLTLEAAGGNIGAADKALTVSLTGKLNARASGNVNLYSPVDLAIDYLFAKGVAALKTEGVLHDSRRDNLVNIRASGINLEAASIGTASNGLGVCVEQEAGNKNALTVNTSGAANILNAEDKTLYISGFTSGGDIKLASNGGDILNADAASLIKTGGNMSFTCVNCSIGAEEDKLNANVAGIISANVENGLYLASLGLNSKLGDITSAKDIHIYSNNADLVLSGLVKADNGSTVLNSVGSIYSQGGGAVQAKDITLTAQAGSVGQKDNNLKVDGSVVAENSNLNVKAVEGIYLTGFGNGLRLGQIVATKGDVSFITDEDIKVNDIGGLANITADNITLHSNSGQVGEADNFLAVDVNAEGGRVNVIGGQGIYLKQLRYTFNSAYIKNTQFGDTVLKVPFSDVNIEDLQKQRSFNIMLADNRPINDISLLGINLKRIISDPVYNRLPRSALPAKLKIFDNEFPAIGYDKEPARIDY